METISTSIELDVLIVDKQDAGYISQDWKEIEQELIRYYSDAFKKYNVQPQILSDEWCEEYDLIKSINPKIYDPLTETPTDEEIKQTLCSLSNGKALDFWNTVQTF